MLRSRPCTRLRPADRQPILESVFKNTQIAASRLCSIVDGRIETAYSREVFGMGSVGLK